MNNIIDVQQLYTVSQASRAAGVTPSTIVNWITSGKLDAVRLGRIYVVEREALHRVSQAAELFTQEQRAGGRRAAARRRAANHP